MAITWLKTASGFDKAWASSENYPDGHITLDNGEPAFAYGPAKFDLGIKESSEACRRVYALGATRDSTVYGMNDQGELVGTAVNKASRSSKGLLVPYPDIAGAISSLEMQSVPYFGDIKCDSFRFDGQPYDLNFRQFLAYGAGDHFDALGGAVKGHADDSLYQNNRWERNDSKRHIVGIIWPNGYDENAKDDDLDRFSGGEIAFPFLTEDRVNPLSIKVQAGYTAFFPASPPYVHLVRRVSKGLRISLSTWWTFNNYRQVPLHLDPNARTAVNARNVGKPV